METVSATDPDEGGNGQFRYNIESGDPDDQFAIGGKNASVTNQGSAHNMAKKFENAALFLRLGPLSKLFRHEN